MFPPEIFSEIFSFLASEARVLVACSQAHPIFARLVEPTLYAHVIVHNNDLDTEDEHHLKLKPYQLSALLSNNPRILNYLRSLCVDHSKLYNDEVITAILPGLKLERIQLTSAGKGSFVDWQSFPMALRTAFVACISTSFMKEICLDKIVKIPLTSFVGCAGLKRLALSHLVVSPSHKTINFPHLDALELSDWKMDHHSHHFFSWALTHACGLRSLTLSTPWKEVICRFLPHLLTICSTSLANLSLYYVDPCKSIDPFARIVLMLS